MQIFHPVERQVSFYLHIEALRISVFDKNNRTWFNRKTTQSFFPENLIISEHEQTIQLALKRHRGLDWI